MKKKTGFTDCNNKEINVGDKVRIYSNCTYRKSDCSIIGNCYEGIIDEDNNRIEDKYRIVHSMGNASLAWECHQRREFIEKILIEE